jgi:hypothetical protein
LVGKVDDEIASEESPPEVASEDRPPELAAEESPPELAPEESPPELAPEDRPPLPWHIKLLGGAFLVYVLLRLIQIGGWVLRWLAER